MDRLVLGGASWNRMIYCDTLPDGRSATVFGARYVDGVGSTGVGKAFALRALGHDPVLHGVLGDDDRGRLVHGALAARGVRAIVDIDPAHATPHHVNLMDGAGRRVSYLLENGGAKPQVDRAQLAPLIAEADVIFASITASTRPILDLVAAADALVQVDLHDWDEVNDYHRAFIEVADIVQVSDENLSNPAVTAEALLCGRAREVVMTEGAAGADVFDAERCVHVPAVPAEVRASNGAGDAFGVVYTLARKAGLSVPDAGRQAAEVAAQVVASDEIVPENLNAWRGSQLP
ncbi:MAG: PfkB family carbohydrate kinase [Pseudomonadota bacterium]